MASKATAHVALLRGINVGGKNTLPMKDLVAIFQKAGFDQVQTYIQSGNVIFNAIPSRAEAAPTLIAAAIQKQFGFSAPVVIRSAAAFAPIVSANPFLLAGEAEDSLHVAFLAEAPTAAAIALLDPERSPPDRFVARGAEIFLCLPKGVAKTKLTNAYFDSKLKTVSTVRNWRSVLKLHELASAL